MTAAPVAPSERIQAMDVLRGVALCGILIVNIQHFSMINQAVFNPSVYGDLTGPNRWAWILTHVFAMMKFMTIFSIMYGAGIALLTGKLEAKGLRSAPVHYRRTMILIVVGALHGYLLWSGDILFWYGMCALLVYLFRRMSPKKLLIIAAILICVPSLLMLIGGFSMPYWPQNAVEGLRSAWQPGAEAVREEVEIYRGGWLDQMAHRVPLTIKLNTFVFGIWAVWRVTALMLLGMALYKWGVITAGRSTKFYSGLTLAGLVVGLPIVVYGVTQNIAHNFSAEYSKFLGSQFNYWGSIFMSGGYMGAVMLICKGLGSSAVLKPVAAVGRMAFTNYIMQTVICTTIFYGHGFGLFGSVERTGQLLIVFCIWVFQLIVSPIWLRYFRFGPLEWAWRSLTYLRPQPMRVRT